MLSSLATFFCGIAFVLADVVVYTYRKELNKPARILFYAIEIGLAVETIMILCEAAKTWVLLIGVITSIFCLGLSIALKRSRKK